LDYGGGNMLSESLRRYIRERGISPAALARQIGQHRSTLTRWLSGERGLSEEALNKIAVYLKLIPVPIEALEALHSMETQIERLELLHGQRVEITDRLTEAIRLLAEDNARLREQLYVAFPTASQVRMRLAEVEAQLEPIRQYIPRDRRPKSPEPGGRISKTRSSTRLQAQDDLERRIDEEINIEIEKGELESKGRRHP
jgi:transcriptional regulator with XRE-family HTH domain